MKTKKIKTDAELLAALRADTKGRAFAELVSVDGTIKGVRIGTCHIAVDSYTFTMAAETEFEELERYVVRAKVKGFPDAISYHETRGGMRSKMDSYGDGVEVDNNDGSQVQVLVNEAGEVCGLVADRDAALGIDEPLF